jgi:hypothetical protein
VKIESKIGKSNQSEKEIFQFISDFDNFKDLLPADRVRDWESSGDQCSFYVDPVGTTGLRFIEKKPNSLLKIASVPEFSSYQFTIWIQLKKVTEQDTRMKITIEPHVSKLMLPMIKSPLKLFVDGLINRMEKFEF